MPQHLPYIKLIQPLKLFTQIQPLLLLPLPTLFSQDPFAFTLIFPFVLIQVWLAALGLIKLLLQRFQRLLWLFSFLPLYLLVSLLFEHLIGFILLWFLQGLIVFVLP